MNTPMGSVSQKRLHLLDALPQQLARRARARQVVANLVLPLARAQRRAHRAHQRGDARRPLEHGDVAEPVHRLRHRSRSRRRAARAPAPAGRTTAAARPGSAPSSRVRPALDDLLGHEHARPAPSRAPRRAASRQLQRLARHAGAPSTDVRSASRPCRSAPGPGRGRSSGSRSDRSPDCPPPCRPRSSRSAHR